VLETFIPSHGALTLAAVLAFVVGSLLLFDPAGDAYQVSWQVSVAIALTLGLMMALVVGKLVQVRRNPVEVGVSHLVGEQGVVRDVSVDGGLVFVNGELWRAHRSDGTPLRLGEDVAIEGVVEEGLELIVAPLGAHAAQS
jgi:membrane-bound serine protease (ClpP class)